MDEQDKIIKRTAIHQDTINGLNGPATWPIQWWAEKGDVVWTGGVANREGYDFTNMYFKPGDVIVHKNVIQGDGTKPVGAFNIYPEDGTDVMREVLDGIREWDHGTVPDRWGVAEHPGQVRLEVPGTGKTLGMGWGDGLALASTAAGRLDPELLQASLLQSALDYEPRPCVFFQEDDGYDVVAVEWHQDEQGRYDSYSFKHLQYDDTSMQVRTISHLDEPQRFPAKTMGDGELLAESRVIRDDYQRMREHDAPPVARGFTGPVMRSGILKPGTVQRPLLHLIDGRTAPEWDSFIDDAATSILAGQPIRTLPTLPQAEPEHAPKPDLQEPQTPQTGEEQSAEETAKPREQWPNAWVDNQAAHPYTLHARDGRDWQKMIVALPKGTVIDGRDMGGWRVDLFMSQANQRQKSEDRDVNLRFRPGTTVELFHGKGIDRLSYDTNPAKLADAIRKARNLALAADDTIDQASKELMEQTKQANQAKVETMGEKFAGYLKEGKFKPQVAVKWARRLVDATAQQTDGKTWTFRQRRQATQLLIDELTGEQPERTQTRPTERLAKAEAELKAAQETLDEPFAQEDEYQAKLAELKAMGSNPKPKERQHIGEAGTSPRQQEGTTMDDKNAIPKHGWIVLDPPVTHSYEDITGDPDDKDDINQLEIDRYQATGRIGILAYKDGDEWDRMWGDLTVNKPDIPLPENTFLINEHSRSLSRKLRQAGWIEPVEDAPGVWKLTDKAIGRIQLDDPTPALDEPDETIPAEPAPEAYAFRWHNATGPVWHTEYHSTEEERDRAMQEKKDTGHLTQPILEDPAVLYEEHRKTTCAATSLRLADAQPTAETTALLRDLVDKVLDWRPDDEIGHLKTYPSADAIEQAGQGLSPEDIKEKQTYGGWDPKRDELMRIDEQGDWQGLSQSEADRLLWDHRSDILDAAGRDDMLPSEDVERIGRTDAQAETGQEHDQPTEERDAQERDQTARDEPEQEEPEQEEPEPRRGLHM